MPREIVIISGKDQCPLWSESIRGCQKIPDARFLAQCCTTSQGKSGIGEPTQAARDARLDIVARGF